MLAGLAGGVAAAIGLGARRRAGAQTCGEIDDACFSDFDCCREACFRPQGRRRGKCVCPEPECGGECCTEEQVCGTVAEFDFDTFETSESEGCCLPPGGILVDGCNQDTVAQCCDLAPESGQIFLCCMTDDSTGLATCCDPNAPTVSASGNRIVYRRP